MRSIFDQLEEEAERVDAFPLRATWSHGDFKPENVLCDGHKYVILDTQLEGSAAFVYDLASFLDHLLLAGQRVRGSGVRASISKLRKISWPDMAASVDRSWPHCVGPSCISCCVIGAGTGAGDWFGEFTRIAEYDPSRKDWPPSSHLHESPLEVALRVLDERFPSTCPATRCSSCTRCTATVERSGVTHGLATAPLFTQASRRPVFRSCNGRRAVREYGFVWKDTRKGRIHEILWRNRSLAFAKR